MLEIQNFFVLLNSFSSMELWTFNIAILFAFYFSVKWNDVSVHFVNGNNDKTMISLYFLRKYSVYGVVCRV